MCGICIKRNSHNLYYNDTYSESDASFKACNHIPTDLHILSKGIPLKCYTVRCYTGVSEVPGSCHYGKDKCYC